MATRGDRASGGGSDRSRAAQRSIIVPGILLGLGLGGFVDGILLHQILQWHHMRSGDGVGGDEPLTTVGGLEANTIADGLFHAGTWLLVVVGLFMLWHRVRSNGNAPSWTELAGTLLIGWGVFNVVEGVVNHHLLGIHHLRDDLGAPLGWDLGFLAFGVLLVVVGWLIVRPVRREIDAPAGATS